MSTDTFKVQKDQKRSGYNFSVGYRFYLASNINIMHRIIQNSISTVGFELGYRHLLTQIFPAMNYVFSDKELDANGVMKTNTIGDRYIIHIGFNF